MPLKLTGSLEYDCEEVGCLISKCLCGIGIFSSAFGWRGDDGLLATSCLHYSSTPSSCTSPFSFLCVLLRLQRRRAVSFGPFLLAGVVLFLVLQVLLPRSSVALVQIHVLLFVISTTFPREGWEQKTGRAGEQRTALGDGSLTSPSLPLRASWS